MIAYEPSNIQNGDAAQTTLKNFQLTTEGIKDKSSKEWGYSVSREIYKTITSGLGGYYFNRNARFRKNRNYAHGRLDVQAMFRDRFQFDGKTNYISLNWQALQIVNRIVSGLVGRWMQKGEKISVTAIDSLSTKQKQDEYDELEAIVLNRRELEQLEIESGVQLVPKTGMPADDEELRLWQAQIQRLPEEILYELGCNDVLSSNGFFDVIKEKLLHDAAEVLLVGTYTWMDQEGVIHVRWVKPENAIYSFSEYPDFRDTTWRGEAPAMKISEIRKMYGKEFNPNNPLALSEEQLFEIAQKAKEYQYYSNITWTDTWYTAYLRPYDEWNVRSIQFEIKTVDSEPYTITKTKTTGTTYTQKGYPTTSSGKRRSKPSDNQNVIEDSNWNIYRGVYLPDCDLLLEWGLKKNMIRPQDPKEIGNSEFSYSFYMPQNYEMRNLAIPEKIEAAVDGMILALLKMQQVVARMRPTGAAIDESALQNIDYGLGEAGNKDVDYKKLYDQTGDIYYRGIDAEGNRIPIPIQELANSGFLGQMDGLIRNYQFNYQILKDELGEDPNLISAALQPRVTAGNVEASQLQSEYATDYIYRAYVEVMKMTARKISCLLKDSVVYGAKAYRTIVNAPDISNRIFNTDIQLLPTQFELQRFEAMMNQALLANPDLIMFCNPFELIRVAKENVKLATDLFRQAQKKMIAHQIQMQRENQQATFQAQIQSGITAEEEKRKTKEKEGEVELLKTQTQGDAQAKNTILAGYMAMLQKQQETGMPVPAEMKTISNVILQNVVLPAIVVNEQQKQMVLAQMQQTSMQEQQMMQNQQEQSQPPQAA